MSKYIICYAICTSLGLFSTRTLASIACQIGEASSEDSNSNSTKYFSTSPYLLLARLGTLRIFRVSQD